MEIGWRFDLVRKRKNRETARPALFCIFVEYVASETFDESMYKCIVRSYTKSYFTIKYT